MLAAAAAAADAVACLLFVEPPTRALSMLLMHLSPPDMQVWLDRWEERAAALIRLAQRERSRSLMLIAGEAAANPMAVRRWLGQRLNRNLPPVEPMRLASVDPLCHAVAVALCAQRPSLERLARELMASCDLLDGAAAGESIDTQVVDAASVVAGLQALRRADQAAGQTTAAQSAAEAAATQAAAAARQELDALRKQLQTQSDALAEASRQRDALRTESQFLMSQLHTAQEALERAEKRLRQPVAPAPSADAGIVIGELRAVNVRDESPYREITFTLRGVQAGDVRVPAAQVRLVEHHGNPGITFFAPDIESPALLGSWRGTGREGTRDFMLIVPADASSRALLDAMDSRDWRMLLAIAARMTHELRSATAPQRAVWLPLARRLHEQLLALPPRLRHGKVTMRAAEALDVGAMEVSIEDVTWGPRQLPVLSLPWIPMGARRGIALRCDNGESPLLSWPDDESDAAPQALYLPLGSRATEGLPAWRRLPEADREFLRALLLAWPTIVERAADDRAPALNTAAIALRDEAARRLPAPWPEGRMALLLRMTRRLRNTAQARPVRA